MAELGWTRPEIRVADPADILGIRWALFARSLARTLDTLEVDRLEQSIRDEEHAPSRSARLIRSRSALAKARELHHDLRVALLLEGPDADDDDEET